MTSGPSRGHLLRVLGVGFGLAVTVGNTIGAGIVRTPGEVAAQLQDPWLFVGVWVAGGLYALLGAISLAELGTLVPRSGGQYVFARRALGEYAGFLVGWSDWISTSATNAAVAMVVGEYAGALVPVADGAVLLVASAAIVFFALLQWRGLRWGSRTQGVTALLKVLGFATLVFACFAAGRPAEASAPAAAPPSGTALAVAIVVALQSVIFTYDGWTGTIYFSEELRDPRRDVLRSMLGGALCVMGVYVLVNLALLYVLPLSELAGDKFALGTAARRIFGEHGDAVVRALMIVSMLSAINANHLMATRVLYAMSRDGLFFARVARVNPGGTPSIALAASTGVALLFLLSGTFEKTIAVATFFYVLNYAISFTSVFVLRRREPDVERPYRVWGYPWTTAIALAGSLAFLGGMVAGDTTHSLVALAVAAASYPVFLGYRRLRARRDSER